VEENNVASARFEVQGMTVEVEPCGDAHGTWRARVIEPPERRGPWSEGGRAWQAIDAAVQGVAAYGEPFPS
jgi:hypothetical protein